MRLDRKLCPECQRTRNLKFFSSSRKDVICNDCKHKRLRLSLRNAPKAVNKRKDNEWTKAVKQRAGFKCEYCGKTENLNAHHIFSRSNHSVRWDIDNGVCLCVSHHVFNSQFSAHKTPLEFIFWIKDKRGVEWYDNLRAKAKKTTKDI